MRCVGGERMRRRLRAFTPLIACARLLAALSHRAGLAEAGADG